MAEVDDLIDRYTGMKGRQSRWLPYWQQLADVLLPTQAHFTSTSKPGVQQGVDIYDGTPRLALRDLATTLDGLVKPKSSNWFDVEVDDESVMAYDEVKRWLDVVKNFMWSAIYRKDARFIQRSGEVDNSLACFGWGCLWIQENKFKNGLQFRTFHNSKVMIDENDEGVIDKICVEENLTASQAKSIYERVGAADKITTRIMDDLKNRTSSKTFKFIQLVVPNDDYDAKLIGIKGMKFVSCLIDHEEKQIIEKTGYHEFPAAVPRWETSPGEVYARSPGMMALPDAQTLQAMGKTLLIGGQRAVDPPIWIQNDAIISPLRSMPGGVTIMDTNGEGQPIGTFPVSTNMPIGRDMQNDYRRQVEAAFFKNVFNLPIESRQMTATEIIARKEEFIRVIGPVFGRLETDYIGHIVDRVFGIMDRAGVFPQRPEILENAKITFRFKSPIQQARKQMEIAGLGQALQFLAPLAEVQPEIMDNFDGDAIARDAPEWSGLPNKWIKSQKAVDEKRAGMQQAGQAQQQLAAAGPISNAIKNIASAESLTNP